MPLAPEVVEHILKPEFEEAKQVAFLHLLKVQRAYAVMLAAVSILDGGLANRILGALDEIAREGPDALGELGGECEDLFFAMERRLIEKAGRGASDLHIGRSRNDISATVSRMVLREGAVAAGQGLLSVWQGVLDLAGRHVATVMCGYTHGQEAQPTTLAHYLGGLAGGLSRDFERLKSAYRRLDLSPLGAGAFTTTGFPIDRRLVADLLGFEGVLDNSYDCIAVAPADSKMELMSALVISALGVGRFLQDLNLWSLIQPDGIRLGPGFMQASSIMPQKQNPALLEFLRGGVARVLGCAQELTALVHNTQLQDLADIDHLAYVPVRRALGTVTKVYALTIGIVASLEVDPGALLAAARRSFSTATELADTLVRRGLLDFRSAHRVAAWVVGRCESPGAVSGALVQEAAREALGADIQVPDEAVRQALDPVRFVEVRSVRGGPEPAEMRRQLGIARRQLDDDRAWLEARRAALEDADRRLMDAACGCK